MLSPRRGAHLGVFAAGVLFLTCMGVLVLRGSAAARLAVAQPGSAAPDLRLPDTDGEPFHLADQRGAVVVLYFGSIHCPVSTEYEPRVAALIQQYAKDARVRFVGVNSRVPPRDIELREIEVQNRVAGVTCRQLVDATTDVAERFGVDVTPTFFVIDPSGVIRYRGAFDDNRNAPQARTHYVADALRSVLVRRPVDKPATIPLGCKIR